MKHPVRVVIVLVCVVSLIVIHQMQQRAHEAKQAEQESNRQRLEEAHQRWKQLEPAPKSAPPEIPAAPAAKSTEPEATSKPEAASAQPADLVPAKPAPEDPAPQPGAEAEEELSPIFAKASKWMVPKIDFKESKLADIMMMLEAAAKKADAEGKGARFTLGKGVLQKHTKTTITLTLEEVSVLEVAKYVGNLSDLKVVEKDGGIVLINHER